MLGQNMRRSLNPGNVGETPLLAKQTKQVQLEYAAPPADVRWSTRVSSPGDGDEAVAHTRPSTVQEIQAGVKKQRLMTQ